VQKKPFFEKFNNEATKDIQDGFVCLFVFNPRDEAQKKRAKQMKAFVVKQQKDQTATGRRMVFFHASFENKELGPLFQQILAKDHTKAQIVVLRGKKFKLFMEDTFDSLDEFLEGIAKEDIRLDNID
jgi:hypothetical protein